MVILVDTRQKDGKHTKKHSKLLALGHTLYFVKLPYGDYMCGDNLTQRQTDDIVLLDGYNRQQGETPPAWLRKQISDELRGHASIDTKQDMQEVYNNLVQQHERFRRECITALETGATLTILVEDKTIKTLEDIYNWKNPRAIIWQKKYGFLQDAQEHGKASGVKIPKPPLNNSSLLGIMRAMSIKYGVKWAFSRKESTAETIVKILENKYEADKS